jgi:hypothetical protein
VVFAAFPWIEQLLRRAGRGDLTTLDPFAIPPTVAALTAGVVGAVLASRRPRNPVGWLLLAMDEAMTLSGTSVGYIPYGLVVRPGSLPAADIVARPSGPCSRPGRRCGCGRGPGRVSAEPAQWRGW